MECQVANRSDPDGYPQLCKGGAPFEGPRPDVDQNFRQHNVPQRTAVHEGGSGEMCQSSRQLDQRKRYAFGKRKLPDFGGGAGEPDLGQIPALQKRNVAETFQGLRKRDLRKRGAFPEG
mmetsp:Transcript_20971/g.54578  ORF Transcript_20971/g.54578 Transcript_20971/m.54578 type:complete len:119 (+) Transcript_20971:819-1175(+)